MATAPVTRAVKELKEIPFGYLIGQPLKAAVEAQVTAAKTTIDFIEKVGFIPPDGREGQHMLFVDESKDADAGRIRNLTFQYKKRDQNNVESDFELTVPILSIVPIPTLRLDEVTVDFTAKLTDTIETTRKKDLTIDAQGSVNYKPWWSPVEIDVRTSVKSDNSSSGSEKYNREYSMNIHVRAVQDAMPAGLSRILGILETLIKETKK